MEDIAKAYFESSITDRERAIFETGIALAFAYHQFIGLPFKTENKREIARAIEKAILAQPFRVYAKVKIKSKKKKSGTYMYGEITKENLEVIVKVKYGNFLVSGRLRYIKEMRYPLMYIENIEFHS